MSRCAAAGAVRDSWARSSSPRAPIRHGEAGPRLPGTVHTAVAEIEEAGGEVLAVGGDPRAPDDVERPVGQAVERSGGIDMRVGPSVHSHSVTSRLASVKGVLVCLGGTWPTVGFGE